MAANEKSGDAWAPHGRGCSAIIFFFGHRLGAGPARAGVFREERMSDSWKDRRPRTGGGVPPASWNGHGSGTQAPHGRGCSVHRRQVLYAPRAPHGRGCSHK